MITNQILWTACVTPLDESGNRVDYISLERLIKAQSAAGNGILILGSTGEAISLKDEERKEIVKFVCGLKIDASIIVGVPNHNLDLALEWLEFCKDMPIDGFLLTTPIYTKPGIFGQTIWFEKLLNAAQKPSMLYNIPGRAGVKLHSEVVKNLKNNEFFVAIKDSTGSVDSLVEYKITAPDIAVFCGDDYMMPAAAAENASGLVSVASNIWPKATRKYVTECLLGTKMISKKWWHASRALSAASNPIPIKFLLHENGIISHNSLRPPLHAEDLSSMQELIKIHKIILEMEN